MKKSLDVKSAKELDGPTVCVLPGTTSGQNLQDWSCANEARFSPVVIEDENMIRQTFESGRCNVLPNDITDLTGYRSSLNDRQGDYLLLPEVISKEALDPLVRQGEWRWPSIIK